ncbi:MAG: phospho-sugar mutase [Bacteroides sp.]|nr:phospho-sugar mutase [Bacillota bacterium]MCM1393834.1 phospho-sugar mutase [[Eubacterium] siraeum]MCM1455465.1 phospho-sugar mutase [Bacteroides sp.]
MDYQLRYNEWLASDEVSAEDKARLRALTEDEKKEMFFAPLEFGTAGMRGVLDVGVNRMNVFTVRRATKGLADYVNARGKEACARGVVISYDTRKYSSEFAIEVAKVLSANGINAHLFEDVRPVPMCSFAIRRLNAIAGVMITASHNPKIYNGYKVYGEDGAQMSPESTAKVVEYIDKTPYFGIAVAPVKMCANCIKGKDNVKFDEHIAVIGKSVDDAYFNELEKLSLSPEAVKTHGKNVRIVYTPIHGSGYMPVTTILGRMGIKVNVVEAQAKPDTEFSTVRVPNPEEADTLKLGVELANEIGSDIVIGTDPDADRMGIAIRNDKGEFVLLNGNQIGVLLLNYILRRKKENGTLPKNGALVKTIVTTELARKLADSYGATTFDVLTGFKFIGEKIKEWEDSGEYTYLFGFEESYGSLVGTHARDKDAVVAAMTFAEMVCYLDSVGESVYGVLQDIFKKFGYFVEKATSVTFGGLDGMENMKNIMLALRGAKYIEIEGAPVLAVSDFVDRKKTYADGSVEEVTLPKTNALKLHLANGDWICVRPSGTEPKLKFYVATSKASKDEATALADRYLAHMRNLVK